MIGTIPVLAVSSAPVPFVRGKMIVLDAGKGHIKLNADCTIVIKKQLMDLKGNKMNNLLPIFIKVEKQPCLVVGGGKIAYQKIQQLLDSKLL